MSKILSIYCPGHVDPYDSYGLIACELSRHLTRMGVYVNIFARGNRQMTSQDAEVAAITAQPISTSLGGVILGYPTTMEKMPALCHMGKRVLVTMFESTRIPPTWIEPLNQCAAIIVPSRFCLEAFRACGVTVPIYLLPLGIGTHYQPIRRTLDDRQPFTFLAFGDRGRRKGGEQALFAFANAFGDDPSVRFILKMRPRPVPEVALDPNIEIIQADYTEAEMMDLYGSAHCLVNPNMGEGFGLIPRQYAATGGITLTTGWGGTADDLDEWGIPIPYDLVKADWKHTAKFAGMDLGEWAQPSAEKLAALLVQIRQDGQARLAEAAARAHRLHELYSWQTFAKGVLRVWEGVQ